MTKEEKLKTLQELNSQIQQLQAQQSQPSTMDKVLATEKFIRETSPLTAIPDQMTKLIQKGADIGGEKVAEFMGGHGANPNVAAGVGTAIQMAPHIANAALTMGAGNEAFNNVKPTGPYTAALKEPEVALPGALNRAQMALGASKQAARVGEDAGEAARLRGMIDTPGGVRKLANEAIKLVDGGAKAAEDVSNTQLLAYREALGKMQAKGGTFANDYKQAFDKLSALLKEKAPDLAETMASTRLNYLAHEGPEFKIPFLEGSISPTVGALKGTYSAMRTAPVRRIAGAAVNMATRAAVPTVQPTTQALMNAYDKYFNRKKGK